MCKLLLCGLGTTLFMGSPFHLLMVPLPLSRWGLGPCAPKHLTDFGVSWYVVTCNEPGVDVPAPNLSCSRAPAVSLLLDDRQARGEPTCDCRQKVGSLAFP